MATCVGPPDSLVMGSTTVFIGGKPAVRMGDLTAHGGVITAGCPTVIIGDMSSPGAGGNVLIVGSAVAATRQAVQETARAATADGAGEAAASGANSSQAAALIEAAEEGVATVDECPHAGH
jgi:hypothetical protein